MRAIVDVHIDFCTQKVLLGDVFNCHQTDEWKDPNEGKQDCLMDRVHLCANKGDNVNWDFTSCLFINQFVTTNKVDHMRGFNQTVEYCSNVWGLDYKALTQCAYSDTGARLLQASHTKEVAHNTNTPNINWIVVDGVKHETTADWLQVVCDAYTGSPKPASCKASTPAINLAV